MDQPMFFPICFLLLFIAALGFTAKTCTAGTYDETTLAKTGEIGYDPACILNYLQEVEAMGAENHSLIIMRGDKILLEAYAYPYAAEIPHEMFSVTKSIVSTAVGFAVAEGRLALDTKIIDLFSDYDHRKDPRWDNLTIESLLTMHSGKKFSFIRDMSKGDYVETFMKAPFRKKKGFVYSNDDAHVLAAAVAKAAGEPLVDYLMPRLFLPLGMEKPFWETDARGYCIGGTGIYLKTSDVAKICNCYRNGGRYKGKQIIPAKWALAAVKTRVQTEEGEGYGYLFWCNEDSSYKMGGMFGQYGVVYPQHDAVVAVTGCAVDEIRSSELYSKYFPLAFEKAPEKGSMELLESYLEERNRAAMAIPASARSPLEEVISGKTYRMSRLAKGFTEAINNPVSIIPMALNVTFARRPRESMDHISFDFGEDSCIITWQEGESQIRLISGMDGKPRLSEIERCGYPYRLWSHCRWEGSKLMVTVKPINTVATQHFEFTFKKNKAAMKIRSFPDFPEFAQANAVPSGQIPDIKVITPTILWGFKQALRYTRLPFTFKADRQPGAVTENYFRG